jgi:hypothetical protein
MKKNRTMGRLLGTIFLMLGAGNSAWAVNYVGALDFGALPPTPVLNLFNLGIDLDRYDLGSALSGPVAVTFTTTSFTPSTNTVPATTLGVLFATDPNDAIFSNPTSLAGLVTTTTDVSVFLNAHVIGWQYFAWSSAITPGGTTNISNIFTPPMSFTAGTTYYAFVAGGSTYNLAGQLTNPSVGYTLSVNAVPEPEAWAMMAVGLALVALRLRRRTGTALA